MACISINDNLMMCLCLYYWLAVAVKIWAVGLWECKILCYFITFSQQNSAYQVLAMTTDKHIAIKWQHRAATYSTPKRGKLILLSIFFCALIYNCPYILISGLDGDICLSYVFGGIAAKVFSWTTILINGIIPFSLLIHMNYVIVQSVINSRKLFRPTAIPTVTESVSETKRQKTMKSAEHQLTIMLLLVTSLFLILLLPTYIRYIYFSLVKRDTPSNYANSMLLFQITYKLYTTNNGINFFLYCMSCKRFRNDLKEILCCVVNSPAHTSSTVEK